jgi:hypothetical protein
MLCRAHMQMCLPWGIRILPPSTIKLSPTRMGWLQYPSIFSAVILSLYMVFYLRLSMGVIVIGHYYSDINILCALYVSAVSYYIFSSLG